MTDLQQRRLRPSLLDQLTDEAPFDKQQATPKGFSDRELRRSIVRDLEWLFNTTELAAVEELEAYPEVARSVLNFGLPTLVGRLASGINEVLLERSVKQTIVNFEPRILPGVKVRVVKDKEQMSAGGLRFEIEGELRAQPAPLYLLLRTDIDLDNRVAKVTDLSE